LPNSLFVVIDYKCIPKKDYKKSLINIMKAYVKKSRENR